jgi:curved DNA-binding protein CbpA
MKRFLRNIRHFKNADAAEIKKHTEKRFQYHPDKNPGDKSAEEKISN